MYTNFIDDENRIKPANYPVTEEQNNKNRRLARRNAKKARINACKKAQRAARKIILKKMQIEIANGRADSDLMAELSSDFKKIFAIKDKKILFQISKNYSWFKKRGLKKRFLKTSFFVDYFYNKWIYFSNYFLKTKFLKQHFSHLHSTHTI